MDPLLSRLSDSLASARSLEDLTRPLLEMLEEVTRMESTYLTRIDFQQSLQHVLYARNTQRLQIPEGLDVPWGDTLCRRALQEERIFTPDVPACWGDSDAAASLGIQSYVSVPVQLSDGGVFGTLCAASSVTVPLPPHAEKVLRLFAKLIAQQVEREQLMQALQQRNAQLTEMALVDSLTGVPNRRALYQELERLLAWARRSGRSVMVAFVDLDDFKPINDQYGHEAGDAL
ncbi:MAG: sensor domain-containing diguanylate cyclase, partial [Giesbergeria sp.]